MQTVLLLTCDLPNGAEYTEFFWVQSFNVVINIPVNEEQRSEQHKHNEKEQNICLLFYVEQQCGVSLITVTKNELCVPIKYDTSQY